MSAFQPSPLSEEAAAITAELEPVEAVDFERPTGGRRPPFSFASMPPWLWTGAGLAAAYFLLVSRRRVA